MQASPITLPPLSLYIHIPWCVKKCPYCDFNSHAFSNELPVERYIDHLYRDFTKDTHWIQNRPIQSIFFGGGTPSLFPAQAIDTLLSKLRKALSFSENIEITLEVNPGTSEYSNFHDLLTAGVNRLSFGAQSFNDKHLSTLGRIHSSKDIVTAITRAADAGFENYNIDLMHSLPQQTAEAALYDLQQAFALKPQHISWYQLTIEANTAFYRAPPPLPAEDIQNDIIVNGLALLAEHGFEQYEISAFCQAKQHSRHNLNYWEFGDYLAIGAGAHGKITLPELDGYTRFEKKRLPSDYMNPDHHYIKSQGMVKKEERAMEFLMNALRLKNGVDKELFSQRTGLPYAAIDTKIDELIQLGLISENKQKIATTDLGFQFLNSVLEKFN